MFPLLFTKKKESQKAGISKPEARVYDATVEEIHREFDTVEERLLLKADIAISVAAASNTHEELQRVEKLRNLGFTSVPDMERGMELNKQRAILEDIRKSASIIREYQQRYPTLKFVTVEELDRICQKYGLIYASVSAFKGHVPDKNLKEISSAPTLRYADAAPNKMTCYITEFWKDTPQDMRELLKGDFDYTGMVDGGKPTEEGLLNQVRNTMGYMGGYRGYIFKTAKITEVEKQGLFIAAPRSDFNLEGLSKTTKFGYNTVVTHLVKDPVVFRYCRGGIQILSKWGPEASDEIVVNQKMN